MESREEKVVDRGRRNVKIRQMRKRWRGWRKP